MGAEFPHCVASEEHGAYYCRFFGCEISFEFNGKVAYATGCVKFSGGCKGSCGACVHADAAAAAWVWQWRAFFGDSLIDEKFGKKNMGSGRGYDEEGVFTCPTDSCLFCVLFFQNRSAVDRNVCLKASAEYVPDFFE